MKKFDQTELNSLDEALTYDDINIVPSRSSIASRKDVATRTLLVGDIILENPVVPANMDSITDVDMMIEAARNGSIAFLHRFMTIEETLERVKYFYNNANIAHPPCGISVGVGDYELERAEAAIAFWKSYAQRNDQYHSPNGKERLVVMVDVAHGHHDRVIEIVGKINDIIAKHQLEHRAFIIAGNIATGDAAWDLIIAGAHGLKVGVGNGSLCETRIRTGAGVPQVSALLDVLSGLAAFSGSNVTIMADGGVKYPGDVVKALWLGANTVMTGYMFAGTNETPGTVMKKGLFPNEREVKIYRGSASIASKADRGEIGNVEGNIKEVPVKGPASYVFTQIKEGIQSGYSYVGAPSIIEFRNYARACKITSNGVIEARPNFMEQ